MNLKAKWSRIPTSTSTTPTTIDNLVRSSHCLTVQKNLIYIFSGEFKPRTPVEANLSIVNLLDGSIKQLSPPQSTSSSSTISWPAPRVGSSLVSSSEALYLWGGRGGKSMSTFSSEDTSEDLWKYDIRNETWECLITKGEKPEQRSFHCMVLENNSIFLHAGCPTSGRLSTLHTLSLSDLLWSTLADAPAPGRGGTVVTSLPSKQLARFGGFAGFELGGPLDLYDIEKKEWTSEVIDVEGGGEAPEKRSVHALIGLEGKLEWEGKKVVAVLTMGEREGAPAELGHDGAGFFHSDSWALLSTPESKYSWLKLSISSLSTEVPEARGWFASSLWEKNKIIVQGGLNERNERLGDDWILEVVLE